MIIFKPSEFEISKAKKGTSQKVMTTMMTATSFLPFTLCLVLDQAAYKCHPNLLLTATFAR